MKLNKILAAVAILAAGAVNAAVSSFDGVSAAGNGSMILVKADTTAAGVTGGLTVDLGFNFSDFANNGVYSAANTSIVWDFSANTITKNGALVTGVTNDWASQFAKFTGDAAETKWAILSGSQMGNTPTAFLASGTPTALQLTQQAPATTANMAGISPSLLSATVQGLGTFASADNGAYAMGSADAGYVGTAYGVTTGNGWKATGVKWSTWNVDGASTNLWQANANGSEAVVGNSALYTIDPATQTLSTAGLLNGYGTFTFSGNTLTWNTASISTAVVTTPVPEPESYGLALVGLLAIGATVRRRRSAK